MALPPDLARIGDELAAAAARSLRARRRRAIVVRCATTAVAGVLAFAALSPARLGTAEGGRPGTTVLASSPAHAGCDQLRGAQQALPACVVAAPAVTHLDRATLPHGAPPLAE
jgi:hypothetical protein